VRGKYVLLAAILFAAAALVLIPALLKISTAKATYRIEKEKASKPKQISIQVRGFSLAPDFDTRLLTAAPEIRDVCEFQKNIYAATSSGLIIYSAEGKQLQRWTSADGLPAEDLTAIASSQNTLWVGTSNSGILRLRDGKWQQFLPQKNEQRSVTALLITNQGDVLAGTRDGILNYSDQYVQPFHPQQFSNQTITRLSGDSYSLYVGTFSNGLYVYEKGIFHHYGLSEGLNDLLITDIHPSSTGCYVSTPAGIQILQQDKFESVAANLFVTSFFPESNAIYAGTYDRGLLQLKNKRTRNSSGASPAAFRISGFNSPATAATYIRKLGSQVLAFSKDSAMYLDRNYRWKEWIQGEGKLTDSNVSTILRTSTGEVWVGFFDQGIDILSADLQLSRHLQDETFFCINHISKDSLGRIYVSTSNGLAIVEPSGTRRVYHEADGLMSDRVLQALPLDPEGKQVGIATSQGFTLKDGKDFKSIYAFQGLVNNHVYTIANEGKNIYLGTLGGISSLSNLQVVESWTRMDSALKSNWVNALAIINQDLYVGTYGGGIQVRSASGNWTEAVSEEFEVNPNAFYFDGKYLFCGTLDRGFYFYDLRNKKWKHFTKGLPSQNVTAFGSDLNLLFVATDHGILQVKYDKLNTLPDIR
jgi:ligand-binding sensor domain-containing protein